MVIFVDRLMLSLLVGLKVITLSLFDSVTKIVFSCWKLTRKQSIKVPMRTKTKKDLWSITPTFYQQLFWQFLLTKKLQTQNVSTWKLHKILQLQKSSLKSQQKIAKPNCTYVNMYQHFTTSFCFLTIWLCHFLLKE